MFGLFEERGMRLKMKKNEFLPGETAEGAIELSLKKPMPGDRLSVSLRYYEPNEDFSKPVEKEYVTVELGSAMEYSSKSYAFGIQIPPKPPRIAFPETADRSLVDNWKKDDALGSNSFSVEARLEMKGQKPLTARADVKIKYPPAD